MGQLKVNDKRAEHQGKEAPGNPEDLKKEKLALKDEVKVPDPPDYSKINIFMQANRILVQLFPDVEKIGHIFVQGVEDALQRSRIVAIGPDVKNLKVGMVIFKASKLGAPIKTNSGEEYVIFPDTGVIAIDTDYGLGIEDPQAKIKAGWIKSVEIKHAGELV